MMRVAKDKSLRSRLLTEARMQTDEEIHNLMQKFKVDARGETKLLSSLRDKPTTTGIMQRLLQRGKHLNGSEYSRMIKHGLLTFHDKYHERSGLVTNIAHCNLILSPDEKGQDWDVEEYPEPKADAPMADVMAHLMRFRCAFKDYDKKSLRRATSEEIGSNLTLSRCTTPVWVVDIPSPKQKHFIYYRASDNIWGSGAWGSMLWKRED